ncbi:arginine--tRNA ligase, partial [Patescibacteria group bacterium]|nr:arginine--tRNA ligase [Patescibacteria group bacterium]
MGNGRGGFTGDVLTNVLRKEGYKPYKEYYINDFGKQIETLGESVIRRYFQSQGVKVYFPEELYQGEYIKDLAEEIKIDDFNISDKKKFARVKDKVKKEALEKMIKNTQDVLQKKCGIKYNQWFRESFLYEDNAQEKALDKLKKKDLIYVKEGAVWFKSMQFGDDKDRVVIKKDGNPTYFFSDILYMENRLMKRKYSKVIMILGADHHGDIARLKAAAEILDKKDALDVIIYQNVRLIFKGKELKMSKRKGVFVTLDELVDEVGIDAMRFFFLMNSLDKHMDFDISLAKEKSDKNPVYYVQYAHARIYSILEKIKKAEPAKKIELREASEKALLNEIIKFPDILEEVATTYEVHKLPFYSIEIARKFHNFYNQCRVIEDEKVNASRVELIKATKEVLENVLALMGVSAPKKM